MKLNDRIKKCEEKLRKLKEMKTEEDLEESIKRKTEWYFEKRKTMKPSEICHIYHTQMCHECDDLNCCDNINTTEVKK